ncbi:2Fe-2S iron-sulfur cluster binding domain-containing protein [Pandoraea nosoerga]|nr:2Fe-2S iron-sulfur cluster binding domain-containing protein [Pandoraea nosoerga]MBN4677888.1 2Fe-2S iron-sulfur cluster binding domain-containing protein [Pandoraea nosoerga]MBN4683055.1 2Fe-2S iron-sulfur cluster binding domain-containing protein [Pandoraea nosoerga]MBN4747028.1 2Fe-2S iron-sulfur cluster binding domain-containing protein [Pandoraea nosoerga]
MRRAPFRRPPSAFALNRPPPDSANVSEPCADAARDTHAPGAPACRITLAPSGWQFDAPPDVPILLAAQAAGVRLPSLCRNGTCRACLCRAQTGGAPAPVTYRIEWPGMSREEKAEGWLLPCCAYARGELVIDAPDAVRVALC